MFCDNAVGKLGITAVAGFHYPEMPASLEQASIPLAGEE